MPGIKDGLIGKAVKKILFFIDSVDVEHNYILYRYCLYNMQGI